MSKKLLFISKDNLTTNPRLLKELKFAVSLGYDVDFVGFSFDNWSDKIDKEIITKINANFEYISAYRKPLFIWFFSSIIEKLAQKLFFIFPKSLIIAAFAHSKRSFLLNRNLKKKKKYDLIIAHNLPALFPAYKFSKKHKTPFIFDIEDYHPGEAVSEKKEIERRKFLFKNILPKADFITYASPLIGKFSLDLLKGSKMPDNKLINNCFSEKEFKHVENNTEKLKFVWFSQNIDYGRGLEIFIPIFYNFKDEISLALIGNLRDGFSKEILNKYDDFIEIIPPLTQTELNLQVSEFDIGLAIEPGKDFNNEIALSNKIFSYAQAGLFILATNTQAQNKFISEHPDLGILTRSEINDIANKLRIIIKEKEQIRSKKEERFNYSKKLSWEIESKKLEKIWTQIFTNKKTS